jgi:UrcA family protein
MSPQIRTFRKLTSVVIVLCLTNAAVASPSATVDTRGLDLTRVSDTQTLYSRIRSAAISVCRADGALWDGERVQHRRSCVERAIEDAIVRINHPGLTNLHRSLRERVAER